MPCGTSATCDCLCTKVDISGLSYNSISYDTTQAHLPPGTSPDPFCFCTISAVVPNKLAADIFAFLGLPDKGIKFPTVKVNTAPLHDRVENYDEMMAAFQACNARFLPDTHP
jgi:hypothetical protein